MSRMVKGSDAGGSSVTGVRYFIANAILLWCGMAVTGFAVALLKVAAVMNRISAAIKHVQLPDSSRRSA